jgi:hypothetical protein
MGCQCGAGMPSDGLEEPDFTQVIDEKAQHEIESTSDLDCVGDLLQCHGL